MARVLWAAQYCSCRLMALPIALELQARGHQVVVLSTPLGEEWFTRLGFDFVAERRTPPYDWGRRELRPLTPEEEVTVEGHKRWFVDRVPDQVADVMDALESKPCDLVLSDFNLYGPVLAAEKAGLPSASYVTCFFDETRTDAEYWKRFWNPMRAAVGLGDDRRPIEEVTWWTVSADLDLMLGLPELVYRQAPLPPYVHRVGPTLWDPPVDGEVPGWLESLGRDRPAVLLSTSNAWQPDDEVVAKTATALVGADLDVVATLPSRQASPDMPSDVIVTGYFPHGLVFPKLSAIVCSGGPGITNRAAACGVPMVAVPRNFRDKLTALGAARAGAAVVLDPDQFTPEAVRQAVESVLGEPRFADSAARLRQAAARYDGARTGADLIEDLLVGGRR